MKLENLVFDFDKFASEMANLKEKKHFDYLVTIVGEDFGDEEGLGCIYILENTDTRERTSVKMLAKQVGEEDFVIPTVSNIWKVADLLEREVFDFYGIKFLGHPDMRRLYLRNDFKGYPFRKNWQFDDSYSLEDDVEPDYTLLYKLNADGKLVSEQRKLFTDDEYVINIATAPLNPWCASSADRSGWRDREAHLSPPGIYPPRYREDVRELYLSADTRAHRPSQLSLGHDAPPRSRGRC